MQNFKHLLIGVDFSQSCEAAMATALRLARRDGARLTVAHISPSTRLPKRWPVIFEVDWSQAHDLLIKHRTHSLNAFLSAMDTEGVELNQHVEIGAPAIRLGALADELDCDAILVSSGDMTGLERAFLGSTAARVVHVAKRPVWIVRQGFAQPPKRVLVGVDYSPASIAALNFARDLAAREQALLDIAYVYHDPGEAGMFTVASAEDRHRYRVDLFKDTTQAHNTFLAEHGFTVPEHGPAESFQPVETRAVCEGVVTSLIAGGRVSKVLAAHAVSTQADVIVVGSHGHGFLHNLILGSTTERVMRRAPCNVVVIRPPAPSS